MLKNELEALKRLTLLRKEIEDATGDLTLEDVLFFNDFMNVFEFTEIEKVIVIGVRYQLLDDPEQTLTKILEPL